MLKAEKKLSLRGVPLWQGDEAIQEKKELSDSGLAMTYFFEPWRTGSSILFLTIHPAHS